MTGVAVGTIDTSGVRRIVERARGAGRSVLLEDESLDLLDACGIPTCARSVVAPGADRSDLREAAERLGYPVVLKGVVEGVAHKTGSGLVHPGLGDPAALERAADAVVRAGGAGLGALLVQSHVECVRELACGLVRDPSFGPSVMLGFGGAHAELVGDAVFRVAPLGEADARAMMEGLRTGELLGRYRGAAAADRAALGRILVAIGALGLALDELVELDINPLATTADGSPVALDALAVLSD